MTIKEIINDIKTALEDKCPEKTAIDIIKKQMDENRKLMVFPPYYCGKNKKRENKNLAK